MLSPHKGLEVHILLPIDEGPKIERLLWTLQTRGEREFKVLSLEVKYTLHVTDWGI